MIRLSSKEFARQFGGVAVGHMTKPAIRIPAPVKMSKVEEQYERILQIEFKPSDGYEVKFETITFRLPGGSRYTPDFTVWLTNSIILAVETKGAFRLGSAGRSHTAFKEALAAFPRIPFRFAQKSSNGWSVKDVSPR